MLLLLGKQVPSMSFVVLFAFVVFQQPSGGFVTARSLKNIFSVLELRIFCNPNPKYGEETNLIAVVKDLPKEIEFLTRVYSTSTNNITNYMILRFTTPPQEGAQWRKTSNLKKYFDRLHIKDKLPFEAGYYVSASPTFYQYNKVILQIEVLQKKHRSYDATGRKIPLYIKPPLSCMPQLNLFECENALSPMNIEVHETFPLNPILDNQCSNESNIQYKRNVYDMTGQNLLVNLGKTDNPEFEVAAFQLSFTFVENAIRNRVMMEVSTLINATKIVLRCYIHLKRGQVKAEIAGGPRRYVSKRKKILMDGSKSQDAMGGHNPDILDFKWGCTTKGDLKNLYCKQDMSSEKSFTIPKNSLVVRQEYIYTLMVSDKEDTQKSSVAKQVIIVVDRDLVTLEIVCVSNCKMNFYSTEKEVVLKGVCSDCDKRIIHYEWFLDDMPVEQKQTLRTKIKVEKHKVNVKLTIETHDGLSGTAYLTLHENEGPAGGQCAIEPTEGLEVKTNFHIKCNGWKTQQWPLRYYIITKKVTLTACKSSKCEVQLPITKLVVIRVCDSSMICNEVQLPVDVRPDLVIPKEPAAIKKMLNGSMFNINKMFDSGHGYKAHLVLNAIATGIKTAKQAEPILDALRDHLPKNVFELGKMGNLTRTLFDSFGVLDSEEVKLITKVTELLNNNFQRIIDKNMSHHLAYEPFRNITVSLMSVLSNLHNTTATLPKPPQYFIKMIKDKPFTEEVMKKLRKEIENMPIKEARDRTSIWLESNYQLDRLNKYLNDANAWHVGADEDLKPSVYGGVSIQHVCFTIDENTEKVIQTADHIHLVHFTNELLEELGKHLETNRLCLKVVSIKRDLGWWYPQDRQPSKILLSVTVYTKTKEMPTSIEIKNGLIYFIYLGKYKPAQRTSLDDIRRKLYSDNDTRTSIDTTTTADFDDDNDAALWLMEPFVNLLDLSSISYDPNSDNDVDDNDDDNINEYEYTDNDDDDDDDEEEEEKDENDNDNENKLNDNIKINDIDNIERERERERNNITMTKRTFKESEFRRKRVVDDDSDRIATHGTYINALVHGTVNFYEEIHHYHVPLDGKTVLAVQFANTSHTLSVYVAMNIAPKRRQTSNSVCQVPAGAENRTILLANTCKLKGFGFIAIRVFHPDKVIMCDQESKIIDGPANFSFVLQVRACDYFYTENNDDSDDDSEWRMYGCMPSLSYNIARGMTCICQYIATYTAYVFNMPARKIRSAPCIHEFPIRAEIVIFFIIINAILLALLIFSLFWIKDEITPFCSIRVNEQNIDGDMHHIVVVIRTGGHLCATTTANITITFQTFNYEELSFTLYQNPLRPVLKTNTAYIIKFDTRDIRLPTRLGVCHDNAGRYPSWNVAYIEVLDKTTNQSQHFDVSAWIREGQLAVLNAPLQNEGDEKQEEKWLKLFRTSIERNFVNWFGFQPLYGTWRPSFHTRPMTRFERICVWIAKFYVALTISFIYYGRTTIDNFEDEFELFHYSLSYVPPGETVWVCCICYFATNIVQYLYEFVFLPIQDYKAR